jgi:hypothetical protein
VTDAKSVHPAAGVGMNHPVLGAPLNDRSGFQGSTGAPTSGPWVGAPLDAELLRSLFSSTVPGTVGFEEELLLVHRGRLLPADAAAAENRWAALRDGAGGELLDLRTGEARPTHRCVHDLIDAAEPYAPGGLDGMRAMVEDPPVEHLRALGPERVVPWLAEMFTA